MVIPEGFLEGEIRNGYYIDSTMKKCWAAQLEVLSRVDAVCKKHNIQYFADWGTMLGAVRHKGFVPWDDDMDITMKRPDYIKFCQVAEKELGGEFAIVNIHTEKEWDTLLTRIVNSRRVSFEEERLREFHGCPYVIGLDIFPLDYVSPNKEEDEMISVIFQSINGVVHHIGEIEKLKGTKEEKEEAMSKYNDIISEIEQICATKIDRNGDIRNQLLKLQEKLFMMYSEEEATEIALMPDHAGARTNIIFPKECYESAIMMPFEFIEIPVAVGYERLLVEKYTENYMTPVMRASSHEYPFYKKQQKIYDEDVKRLCGRL